jgi:dynein heavy chain
LDEKLCEKLKVLYGYMADLAVEFTRANCVFPCPGSGAYTITHINRIVDCYMAPYKPNEADGEDAEIPKDIEDKLINALVYGFIYGMGGCIDENTRGRFDAFFLDLINGENTQEKYKIDLGKGVELEPMKIPHKLGEVKSVFDVYFDQEEMRWINWMSTVPKYLIDKDLAYQQLAIPTMDSIRMSSLSKMLLENGKHCLLVGPTGTGKSVSLNQLLRADFDNNKWCFYQIGFSAQTSANQTQEIIDGQMKKSRKGVYGPALGKEGVIFVDDLNMPVRQKYGDQPPIELLRQWMDYGGWYDIAQPEKEFRQLIKVRFCAAMGPPNEGKTISNRYIRHFNVVYCEPYSETSLHGIFVTVMDWLFAAKATPPFPQPVQALKDSLVTNTIAVYK